jgi:hypothetical protein
METHTHLHSIKHVDVDTKPLRCEFTLDLRKRQASSRQSKCSSMGFAGQWGVAGSPRGGRSQRLDHGGEFYVSQSADSRVALVRQGTTARE